MTTILIRNQLTPRELLELRDEFHQFGLWVEAEQGPAPLSEWAHIEILYGDRLTSEEYQHAPLLRWIHVPAQSFQGICLREIEQGGHLLLSNTRNANAYQMAEFALAAVLAFTKNLFSWHHEEQEPQALWGSPLLNTMGTLREKTLLQVGLGGAGSEMARLSREFGMRVWGVGQQQSFHPWCDKTYKPSDLHSLLPAADIVSICVPRGEESPIGVVHRQQLDLMRQDSILIITGSGGVVDEQAVAELAREGKFRGVLIDSFRQAPLPRHSPLWNQPKIVVTPDIATLPTSGEDPAYKTFRYNLRCFIHDDFDGMSNLAHRLSCH